MGEENLTERIDRLILDLNKCRQSQVAGCINDIYNELISIGEPVIEPLIAAWRGNDQPLKRVDEGDVFWVLKQLDAVALASLASLVQHKDREVRLMAVGLLGQPWDSRAIEPLIIALGDDVIRIREAAQSALGMLYGKPVYEALIDALNHPNEDVRSGAMAVLKMSLANHNQDAVTALTEKRHLPVVKPLIASHEEWLTLTQAMSGKSPDAYDVELLLSDLTSSHTLTRMQAASTLGEIKDVRAVQPLIEMLNDKRVLAVAARALGAINDPRAVQPLLATLHDLQSINFKELPRRNPVKRIQDRMDSKEPQIDLEDFAQMQNAVRQALWQLGHDPDA